MPILTFSAIRARQSDHAQVYSVPMTAAQIAAVARVTTAGRNEDGSLTGFQRPRIAAHIQEISDFLRRPEAVLPNAIVLAFTDHVSVTPLSDTFATVTIDTDAADGPPGFVVDGQQRLSALITTGRTDFELLVSVLVCRDEAELRRHFVLINNARPLPKSLIYELLPGLSDLPQRWTRRAIAATFATRLNYQRDSSLHGQILSHTNPAGRVRDTAIQRLVMNSLTDGYLRTSLTPSEEGILCSINRVSTFFQAVQEAFPDAWDDHTPRTSRLVHSVGIVSLGYLFDHLHRHPDPAPSVDDMVDRLTSMRTRTAWTSGSWHFPPYESRPWNSLQMVDRDIFILSKFLIAAAKEGGSSTSLPDARATHTPTQRRLF